MGSTKDLGDLSSQSSSICDYHNRGMGESLFLIISRENQVKTCIFPWSLNIHYAVSLRTESQEFLRITCWVVRNYVLIPLINSVGWLFSVSDQTLVCFDSSNAAIIWLPSYFLVPHISCQTFGSGSLIPRLRWECVVRLQGSSWGLRLWHI